MNEELTDGRLSASVAAFLADRSPELSPYSVAHLRRSLERMTVALGNPPTADVTYADLRAYIEGLHRRFKPGTIRPVAGDIRQFWRWAKKRKLAPKNPAKRLRMPSRRIVEEAADPKAAPEADVRKVLDYLAGRLEHVVWRDLFGNLCYALPEEWSYEERQVVRDLFILSFLYETGARAGELWRMGRAAMERAVDSMGPVFCVTSTGKTGTASLRFTIVTAELWLVWSAVHPGGEYAIAAWKPDGPPTPMSTPTLSRMLSRQCERAVVAPFRTHSLRHAKIKRAREAVSLEIVSRLVGHGSAITTAGYGRGDDNELDAAALATGLGSRLWG